MNLKHDRGPIPDHIRATFRELCGQSRIDGLLESVDKLIATLEGSVVSDLEAARTEVAALRRQEVTRERLGDAGGADPEDEQADRVARTCWAIERRLRKVDEALERLDFSGMKIWPTPSSFRRLLREAEDDPAENAPSEGLFTACDKALRGFERAAEQAIGGIRTIVDARRDVAPGDWNDAALKQIRHVLARIEDARKMLGSDSLPKDEVEAVREGLQAIEEERPSADQLAATTQEVLERLETADLPVPVLARALDEVRMGPDRRPRGRRRAIGTAAGRGRPALDGAGGRTGRHRSGDGGPGSGPRRPPGDQGAHPPVPGHTPADVDGVDPGGPRPRCPVLSRGGLGPGRAAPSRRTPRPACHPGPDPVLRRAARLRQDLPGQADRPRPAPPGGDRSPWGASGTSPPSAACRSASGRPRRAGSFAGCEKPRSRTPS